MNKKPKKRLTHFKAQEYLYDFMHKNGYNIDPHFDDNFGELWDNGFFWKSQNIQADRRTLSDVLG